MTSSNPFRSTLSYGAMAPFQSVTGTTSSSRRLGLRGSDSPVDLGDVGDVSTPDAAATLQDSSFPDAYTPAEADADRGGDASYRRTTVLPSRAKDRNDVEIA